MTLLTPLPSTSTSTHLHVPPLCFPMSSAASHASTPLSLPPPPRPSPLLPHAGHSGGADISVPRTGSPTAAPADGEGGAVLHCTLHFRHLHSFSLRHYPPTVSLRLSASSAATVASASDSSTTLPSSRVFPHPLSGLSPRAYVQPRLRPPASVGVFLAEVAVEAVGLR